VVEKNQEKAKQTKKNLLKINQQTKTNQCA
jgi:hypothetical protein